MMMLCISCNKYLVFLFQKSGRPENKRSRIENKSPRRMREEALRGVRDEPTEALE